MSYTPIGKSDTVLIKVQIKDEKGIRCLDSQKEIEFQLLGEGKLIQNMGTSTGSRKIQASNGRASIKAIVKGYCVASAKVQGIPAGFISISPQK